MKRLIGYTAALCLLAITVGCGGVTKTGTLAYLCNSTGTGFTVFSVNTDGTLTTAYISPLPTPQPPKLMAFSPSGYWIYFLDDAGDQIYAYTRAGNGTFADPVTSSPFPVGPGASSLVVSPNNSFVYVALPNYVAQPNTPPGALAIYAIDPATGILSQVGSNLQLAYPITQLLISPKGDTLYGLCPSKAAVLAWSLNATSGQVTGPVTWPVGQDPVYMVLSTNGAYMYVMDHVATNTIPNVSPGGPAGQSPDIFAFNLTGTTLTPMAGSPFNENADLITGIFPSGPIGGVTSNDSRFLFVANQNSHNISVFRLSTLTGEPTEVLGSVVPVNGIQVSTASPFDCGASSSTSPGCSTPSFLNIAPGNNALYLLDTPAGRIFQFAINQTTGQLRALNPASVGAESPTSNPTWLVVATFR